MCWVRRSSQSCRSCCVLQATCILSLWLPAQQQRKYNSEAHTKLNEEQPLSTKILFTFFKESSDTEVLLNNGAEQVNPTVVWINNAPEISKAFLRFSPSSILEISIPDSDILPCGKKKHMRMLELKFSVAQEKNLFRYAVIAIGAIDSEPADVKHFDMQPSLSWRT